MFSGRLLAIAVCPSAAVPMQGVEQIEAVPGEGLRGDRYFAGKGTFQRGKTDPSQEVTLIEREALDAIRGEYDVQLTHLESRRNLLTEGVPLNHLVGKTFRAGEVLLRGMRLCEPCGHLQRLTCEGVQKSLTHRGGLRAQILRGGTLRAGDEIVPADDVTPPTPEPPST